MQPVLKIECFEQTVDKQKSHHFYLSNILHHPICLVNDKISHVRQIQVGTGANGVREPSRGDHQYVPKLKDTAATLFD